MNTKEMNGKPIKIIYWQDTGNGNIVSLESSDDILLEMSATHHGDHDEFWVAEYHKIDNEFREVSRHNTRYIESFEWA